MADILVVDDDQSVANAFERFLRHEGHTCLLASNAEDALRIVDERRPPLAFMDVRMPGIDGLQALATLRSRYPDVFVVIMTAHGTSQTSIDAMRAGAFEYITKPLERCPSVRFSTSSVVGIPSGYFMSYSAPPCRNSIRCINSRGSG